MNSREIGGRVILGMVSPDTVGLFERGDSCLGMIDELGKPLCVSEV